VYNYTTDFGGCCKELWDIIHFGCNN